jgi:phosphatidylinositol-bisphosphatase
VLAAIVSDIQTKIDIIHNSSLPRLFISHNALRFQRVRYKEKQTEVLTLRNDGDNVLTFKFRSLLDDCSWLKLSDIQGAIGPGEVVRTTQFEVRLTAFIKEPQATQAYTDPSCLTNILVLHVIGGSDHFVEVSVDYVQTAFGARISDLVKISVPTAMLTTPLIQAARVSDNENAVPKELWRLLDFIYTNGRQTPNLFVESGDAAEISLVREALDSGSEFDPDTDVHSVCSVLLEFLAALHDPVLPLKALDECCRLYMAREDPRLAQEFMSGLPPENYRSFIFLCSFLRSLALLSNDFRLTAAKYASLFLTPLTQNHKDAVSHTSEEQQRLHLLQFHREGFLLIFLLVPSY